MMVRCVGVWGALKYQVKFDWRTRHTDLVSKLYNAVASFSNMDTEYRPTAAHQEKSRTKVNGL